MVQPCSIKDMSNPTEARRADPAVVGMTGADQWVVMIGATGLGLVVGWGLPRLAERLLDSLPWLPFQGPLTLLVELDQRLPTLLMAALGAVAGLLLGLVVIGDEPRITVGDAEIVVRKGERRTRFGRGQVGAVGIVDKHLVVRDHGDTEVLAIRVGGRQRIADALRERGWPAP